MTITEQKFNYIIKIIKNENTQETYLFFLFIILMFTKDQ